MTSPTLLFALRASSPYEVKRDTRWNLSVPLARSRITARHQLVTQEIPRSKRFRGSTVFRSQSRTRFCARAPSTRNPTCYAGGWSDIFHRSRLRGKLPWLATLDSLVQGYGRWILSLSLSLSFIAPRMENISDGSKFNVHLRIGCKRNMLWNVYIWHIYKKLKDTYKLIRKL